MTTLTQQLLALTSEPLAIEKAQISQINHDEIPLIIIKHPLFEAIFSLQGAQLLHWQPKLAQSPVIWLSENSLFKKGTAIRGGVPICWPWFGNAGLPMHGFARNELWQLTETIIQGPSVRCTFTLTQNEETLKVFPHDFKLSLIAELGEKCQLTLKAEGDFESTAALHSYFTVDAIESTKVSGLGAIYQDRLQKENKPKVEGTMTFDQEVDRIYRQPESVQTIVDGVRSVRLSQKNVTDIVTWNPWRERAKNMADLADDSYHHFVCVESAHLQQAFTSHGQQESELQVTIELV